MCARPTPLIALVIIFTKLAIASNISSPLETIKIDKGRSVSLEYKKAYYEKISLKENGKERSKIILKIPQGRDPSSVDTNRYNKFLFSKPIKIGNAFFIPTLFATRTNSGTTSGQCGSGIEVWLNIIAVQGNSIAIRRSELVQSCQNDIYLQDTGNGKIEDAFQETSGKIIVKWLSHPKNNGDSYSEAIQLD